MKKLALLLVLLAIAIAFFAFDLDRLLTLGGIKASHQRFAAMLDDSWTLVAIAFFLLYVLVTAVSLPGATVMTLAAGALFEGVEIHPGCCRNLDLAYFNARRLITLQHVGLIFEHDGSVADIVA